MEKENVSEAKKKWYQSNWAAVLFLFIFFPVGLYLMWQHTKWPKVAKWLITGFFGLMILGSAMGGGKNSTSTTTPEPTQATQEQVTQEPQAQETIAPTQNTVKAVNTPVPTKQAVKQSNAPATSQTVSQRNAVSKAKSYLNFSGFSHDGLVAQLEYEQFSHEDAVYGADNSGADWNAQAAKKAKSYMDLQGYSRGGLIDQLLYEKFTQAQAEFGANSVGL